MKKKVVLSIIEILTIIMIFLADNYFVAYVSYLQSHEFDIRPFMTYGMVARPLLFLIVGILAALCLKQFLKIIGNKVLFIVMIVITSLLFLSALLYALPMIISLLFGVEAQLGISELIFGLFGMNYIIFLARYAAYFYVGLGIVIVFCFPGRTKRVKNSTKTLDFIESEC